MIGDTAVLRSFSHQELKDFYDKWYDPSLIAIAIAGDVDANVVEELIIKEFSSKGTTRPHLKNFKIEDFKEDEVIVHLDEWAKKTELDVIQLIPPFGDIQNENDYVDYLTRNLLTRLIKERFGNLSFKNPAYIEANISIGNFLPAKGVHISSVELDNDSIQVGLEQFFEQTQQIYRYGFTSGEIEDIKTSYLQSMEEEVSKKEKPSPGLMIQEMNQNFFYNNKIVSKEDELRLLEKYLPELDSVAFVKAINKYNLPKATRFLLTANEEDKDKLPSEADILSLSRRFKEKQIERYSNDVFVPENLLSALPEAGKILKEKNLPEIDAKLLELSNGLRIVYKQTDLDKNNIILSGFRKGWLIRHGFYRLYQWNFCSTDNQLKRIWRIFKRSTE